MSDTTNKERVNRLLDMIVHEVSFVDRAANKRRFLIVKRSQAMAEDLNMEKTEQSVDQNSDDGMPDVINSIEDGDESTDSLEDGDWSEETSPIDQATHALEQLGMAVSTITQQHPDALHELGAKLRQVADMMSGEVGGNKPIAAETPEQPENNKKKPRADEDPMKVLDTFRREIAAITARVDGLMQREVRAQPWVKEREASGMEPIAQLTKAVSALTKMFQSHQQRLQRVEKSYGLPNSLPSNEGASPDKNLGWPLDLNSADF